MMKIQKHIEIVRSTRGALVSLGKYSAEAIRSVLAEQYETVGISVVNDIDDLNALITMQPDLVFMGIKSLPVRDESLATLWISDHLDAHGIAYTGSQGRAIEFESNKLLAKEQVHKSGLATSAFFLINKTDSQSIDLPILKYPLFIKPLSLGGGFGIDNNSRVTTQAELLAKAAHIAEKYKQDSLVEEYLPGREFSVAILRNEYTNKLVAMPVELIAIKNINNERILGKTAKDGNQEIVKVIDDQLSHKAVTDLAIKVFTALGARDYGRIDIRMDVEGKPHFMEANLIPGLGATGGYFPRACLLNANLDYQTVILAIASLGFSRHNKKLTTIKSNTPTPFLDPYSSQPVLDSI